MIAKSNDALFRASFVVSYCICHYQLQSAEPSMRIMYSKRVLIQNPKAPNAPGTSAASDSTPPPIQFTKQPQPESRCKQAYLLTHVPP